MGAGHCGSTLLDLLLGSHSQAFSLGELYRIGQLVDYPHEHYAKICGVCVRRCEFWNECASLAVLKMYFSRRNRLWSFISGISRCVYNPYKFVSRWSGKSVLIDSSKSPNWIKRQLKPSYTWYRLVPYIIYMGRDGRAIVNSYYRKYPERGLSNIVLDWKRRIEAMNRLYDAFPRDQKIKVQYEEVATHPERALQSLCSFLGLDFETDMLTYWVHPHHHVFGNGGTRSLIFKFREKFGVDVSALKERHEKSKRFYDASFYDQMELGIQLDQRWRDELSQEHLEVFDAIGGETNKAFAYE
jgi:hypothetical protein